MATKLKNLKVKKVDFVDAGANPDAHIKLFKRKDDEGSNEPEAEHREKNSGSVWKRLLGFIGKAAGMGQDEIDSAVAEIQKGDSVSFDEKFNEVKNRKIVDEIWDICYALQSSLCSILNDEEMGSEEKSTAMQESLDEFHGVAKDCIKQWSDGKTSSITRNDEEVTKADLEIMRSARNRLAETIEKASADMKATNNINKKGEQNSMGVEIDKSKLTPAEAAFLESIEKRCGVDGGENQPALETVGKANDTGNTGSGEGKESEKEPDVKKSAPSSNPKGDDIYKGLHPAVRAELEELKKFREAAEDKELREVAKKYAIIGKKEDELVPQLKSLKAAGGTAYDDMLAILDQAVDTVEKSGAFSEIGKSGHDGDGGSAEAKIGTIAKGYMEKDASLSYSQAVAKAWEDNPDLMAEYDEQAGF